jgi:hypothetical protein
MNASESNAQLLAFLQTYRGMEPAPRYAVLINGPWGSGKSHLIQQFRAGVTDGGPRVLYVSLNGVATTTAIEDMLLQQLHPIFHSTSARTARRLITGAVKTSIKIDLDAIGADADIEASLPSLRLMKSLTIAAGTVLVFDDVERCAISIQELFGFCTQFVDGSGLKVVLVANEVELARRTSPDDLPYTTRKEKLVGTTLTVRADPLAALTAFIASIPSVATADLLREHLTALSDICTASGYQNLRLVRYAILEFARIRDALPDDIRSNDQVLAALAKMHMMLVLEVRGGHVDLAEIHYLGGLFAAFRRSMKDRERPDRDRVLLGIADKYAALDLEHDLVRADVWRALLTSVAAVTPEVCTALRNTTYMQSTIQPSWVKLWHLRDLDEPTYVAALADVRESLRDNRIESVGELLQVAGILLTLSGAGMIVESKQDVVEIATSYAEEMGAAGKLLASGGPHGAGVDVDAYEGLGYHCSDTLEFRTIVDCVRVAIDRSVVAARPEQAALLLVAAREDPGSFRQRLVLLPGHDSWFYDTPILHLVSADAFASLLLSLESVGAHDLAMTISLRFTRAGFVSRLSAEGPWLDEIVARIQTEANLLAGTLRGYQLSRLLNGYLEPSAAALRAIPPATSEIGVLLADDRVGDAVVRDGSGSDVDDAAARADADDDGRLRTPR